MQRTLLWALLSAAAQITREILILLQTICNSHLCVAVVDVRLWLVAHATRSPYARLQNHHSVLLVSEEEVAATMSAEVAVHLACLAEGVYQRLVGDAQWGEGLLRAVFAEFVDDGAGQGSAVPESASLAMACTTHQQGDGE